MPEPIREFVLLRHELPAGTHWDLMIESGPALATWRLERDPRPLAAGEGAVPAERLPDHRRAYLDYEGPVSHGRGHVIPVDRGTCEILSRTPDTWTVRLSGSILAGTFLLSAGRQPGLPCCIERLARTEPPTGDQQKV